MGDGVATLCTLGRGVPGAAVLQETGINRDTKCRGSRWLDSGSELVPSEFFLGSFSGTLAGSWACVLGFLQRATALPFTPPCLALQSPSLG